MKKLTILYLLTFFIFFLAEQSFSDERMKNVIRGTWILTGSSHFLGQNYKNMKNYPVRYEFDPSGKLTIFRDGKILQKGRWTLEQSRLGTLLAIHGNDDINTYSLFVVKIKYELGIARILLLTNKNNSKQTLTLLKDLSKEIFYASETNDILTLSAIKSANIDLNQIDKDKNGPLHYSANGGHIESSQYLLNNSVNPNIKNKENETPLHIAARKENPELVKLLSLGSKKYDESKESGKLEKNNNPLIDPNVQNKDGDTALHIASKNGDDEIVAILLTLEGIDLNLQNNQGLTPLDLSKARQYEKVNQVLEKANAQRGNRKRKIISRPNINEILSEL